MVTVPRLLQVSLCAVCSVLGARVGFAAGEPGFGQFVILDTSVPDVLQTRSVTVPASLTGLGKFQYELGIGTDEQPAIGEIFDSLTLSLAQSDGSESTILVTGDVFGLTIAPVPPTGLLAGGGITVQEIAVDATLLNNVSIKYAYSVEVSLPPALIGRDLKSSFDFFNNGNAAGTTSYAMVVPEPSVVALAAFGLAVCVRLWNRRVVS
jgi:hypothetical protein